MKLVALKARSVRGIPRDWPDLPIGDKGLIIYGPNGVGKSSIIDAIEFALTQKSTLFSENRAGVSWETASPHVHHGPPQIALMAKDGSTTMDITPENIPAGISAHAKNWLETAQKASFVLRRHMLLAFITHQASKRYDLLEPFFNLDAFSPIEIALKALADGLGTKKIAISASIRAIGQRLRTIFGLQTGATISESTLYSHLNAILTKLGIAICSDVSALNDRKDQVGTHLGGKDKADRLTALGNVKAQAQRLGTASTYQQMLEVLITALGVLEKEVSQRTEEVMTDFLNDGRDLINKGILDTCPLCEKPIDDRNDLLKRLAERIEADARITAARKQVQDAQESLTKVLSHLHSAMIQFAKDWNAIVGNPLPLSYDETASMLSGLLDLLTQKNLTQAELINPRALLDASVADHSGPLKIIDDLIAREGGGERRSLLAHADSMLDALLKDWKQHGEQMEQYKHIVRQTETIGRIHEHAVAARKETVQYVLTEVSETANLFYEQIHPNEGIATSTLSVRAATEKSVEMATFFHGTEAPPLRYFSESHLDTLGLCYFLALRKHETNRIPDFRVLVLDDVLHSVDADHRNRVAQLLKNHFRDFQLVVTTHDPHFYAMLRQQLGSGGYSYRSIASWDIARGPILGDPLTDLDRITNEEVRQTMHHDNLAGAGGRFFEWMLREMTESLGISIQARFKRPHDIGSLWSPTCAKLKMHQGFKHTHLTLVDQLDANGWVRNACGAHYNPTAAPPTPQEVREFATLLAALYQAAWCNKCGYCIEKQVDETWRCVCAQLTYPRHV